MIIFPPFHVKTTMTLDYLNSTLNNNFIFDVCISEQDVIDIISIIQVNKAVGPDNISHKMLKNTMYTIAKPLCTLFNRSLKNCTFPSSWKISNVLPLYKKGDSSLMSNYIDLFPY